MSVILLIVVAAVIVLVVVQLFRMGWRIFRGHEEMEAGGSWGLQLFGRRKGRKRKNP